MVALRPLVHLIATWPTPNETCESSATAGDTRIEREPFAERFREATERAVTFAATMVRQRA